MLRLSVIIIILTNYIVNPQNLTQLNINSIKTQLSNNGYIENVEYDSNIVMYSSGFYLGGKKGVKTWGNGVFRSINMFDYVPGKVDSSFDEFSKLFYVVKSSDEDFGQSWQNWKKAVELGAFYYDGNNDGVYNPVDLNKNGSWDSNEDKPDLIGDYTAWCVYNDSKLADQRKFKNISPLGIEIKQTVFAYNLTHSESLKNTFFIRYIIENTGNTATQLDSVFFGAITDPDIGVDYNLDFVGTDTLLNSIFAYKKEADEEYGYGSNPPAIITSLLQGPYTYIPNVTFIDNNLNGFFDIGTDIPLDSAIARKGEFLGIKYIPGAINLEMTSTQAILKSHATFHDPDDEYGLFNYLIGGRLLDGSLINIRELYIGNGSELGDEADNIPPEYMFSGNPITNKGWLAISSWDYRMLIVTGPFTLNINDEIEIIISFTVGRSNSPLSSLFVAKEYAKEIKKFYESNFTKLPVSVKQNRIEQTPKSFYLYQNYPNPFNPSTTIKYSIPTSLNPPFAKGGNTGGFVTLKVYDVLGRKVATLVNERKLSGNYKVVFNAKNLSTGMYFYELQSGSFRVVKKMLLLR